jgi:hypothetical protein
LLGIAALYVQDSVEEDDDVVEFVLVLVELVLVLRLVEVVEQIILLRLVEVELEFVPVEAELELVPVETLELELEELRVVNVAEVVELVVLGVVRVVELEVVLMMVADVVVEDGEEEAVDAVVLGEEAMTRT